MTLDRSNAICALHHPISNIVEDYEEWREPFERRMLPEKRAIVDIEGQHARSLFLTQTVSVNYLRNAERLWAMTRDLWHDKRWIFDPESLVTEHTRSDLIGLFKAHGFRFPKKDSGIWYQNAETFYQEFQSDPMILFEENDFDAVNILEDVRRNDGFTYIGGNKIGSLWMRLIHEDVQPLERIEQIDIPVDVQIRKVTNALLEDFSSDGDIRQFWMSFCGETGLDPVKIDQPLWIIGIHWNDWGKEYLEEQVPDFSVEVDG